MALLVGQRKKTYPAETDEFVGTLIPSPSENLPDEDACVPGSLARRSIIDVNCAGAREMRQEGCSELRWTFSLFGYC